MSDPYGAETSDEENGLGPDSKPLTAEEAALLRPKIVGFSPWHVIGVQALVGLLVVLATWLISGWGTWGKSAGYGVLAVLVPAMLFARGLTRQQRVAAPGAALAGMFVWEFVKIILTLVMLFAAPRVVADLNWLALLAGFVVTMKASWLAMFWQHRRKTSLTVS
jgi:ATP synthase protein I